jgi:hypothetical protein
MSWFVSNIIPLLNIAGLVCDIIGAVLVAVEVVNQFQGERFKPSLGIENSRIYTPLGPEETTEYRGWEIRKCWTMKLGLIFLLLGFSLQILSNFFQLNC